VKNILLFRYQSPRGGKYLSITTP